MQKHKILSFLLALVVSIGLWVYAVTVVNPDDTTYIRDVRVRIFKLGEHLIYEIARNTLFKIVALTASQTPANRLRTDMNNFRINSFRIQTLAYLIESDERIAVYFGTSV